MRLRWLSGRASRAYRDTFRILVESGLVERRKEGSWVFLTIARSPIVRALGIFLDTAQTAPDEKLWIEADIARLAAVRAERARERGRLFCDACRAVGCNSVASCPGRGGLNAPCRRCSRSARSGVFWTSARVRAGWRPCSPPTPTRSQRSIAAPICCGSRAGKLPEDGADKVRFLIGDFYALPVADGAAETAILHQVLHYAQEPERVIVEIARALAPEGRLLVADFAPHEREELRQRDAHARLGFSDEQMDAWFCAAGMEMDVIRSLAGGALTVKLWLGRRKAPVRAAPLRAIESRRGHG